jgi:hypothetical protein
MTSTALCAFCFAAALTAGLFFSPLNPPGANAANLSKVDWFAGGIRSPRPDLLREAFPTGAIVKKG